MEDRITAVYRPLLPSAPAIARYLERLDVSRRYANRGELTTLLEARLGERLGLSSSQVVLTGSGTAALTAAILASAGRARPEKPYCLCPGYTFVAGALAAEQCGYQPYFVDIDVRDWSLAPEQVSAHSQIERSGVILGAAPYGRAVPYTRWDAVRRHTGVPVIIDAAASIEALADAPEQTIGATPIVLSFHATKAFACGEGGAVLCADHGLRRRVYAALNFGFAGTREVSGPGFNGKMSEYHAAVGLAELDGWDAKRAALREVAGTYRRLAAERGVRIHTAPDVASNYALLEANSADHAQAVCAALEHKDFDARYWYGQGLHQQAHFRHAARDALPGVEDLAPRLIGLPVAHDLDPEVIERIVDTVAGIQ